LAKEIKDDLAKALSSYEVRRVEEEPLAASYSGSQSVTDSVTGCGERVACKVRSPMFRMTGYVVLICVFAMMRRDVDHNILLFHCRFHFSPGSTLQMPRYNKGNVIRGGFGSAFRRIVCHAACRDAETCELRSVCPYTAVFQPFVPEDSERIRRNQERVRDRGRGARTEQIKGTGWFFGLGEKP
jgi:hypothetical protein